MNNSSLMAPVHLTGAGEIAECFGVHRNTVTRWAKEGAPIRYIGRKYQASYSRLWLWLEKSQPSVAPVAGREQFDPVQKELQ